jgi:glyceraldehyde-3-phosphate dehydrogenase type II
MKVLVNGIGNIGVTLLNVLIQHKKKLGISEVYALKNKLFPWNNTELETLKEKGVIVCTKEKHLQFQEIDSCVNLIDYVFDTTINGMGLENKSWYKTLKNLKGCSAQGSEKGFGIPFMSRINEEAIKHKKFVQIVSCNTHAIASLLNVFAGERLENLCKADFVIVRRSEDLGNHERLVTSNVVARHLDDVLGTHHAIDVKDLYETQGVSADIQSSDITTPSQLMHAVRFNIELNQKLDKNNIECLLRKNAYVSSTNKFDSNVIFELGRRYGFMGRIFSHAIVIDNNFLINNKVVKAWAFIPQEGNTILSTINAFLLQTNKVDSVTVMQELESDLLRENW